MATEPAAPAPMTLDRNDGSATMELYRAALGPVHTDRYLKAFTRFDAAGQSGLSWNWGAALLTLNWMLFRRLWLHALAYAGIVAGALLLLLGIARLLFQLPDASLWALAGLGMVLAIVVPGSYGNAWLYAACNKAIDKALPASASLEEACAVLRKRSPGNTHLMGLAACNVVLAVVIAGLVWSGKSAAPSNKSESAATTSRSSQGLVQPAPVPQASAVANVASAPASAASASAPMLVASQAAAPASAPVAQMAASSAIAETPAKPSKAELQAKALEAKKEKAEKAKKEKEAKAAKKAQEAQAAKEAKTAKEAKAKPAVQAAASTASAAPAAASSPYLINVGLFADPNNARNAYTKLQDAGLPAQIKELKSAKGPQIRVRAGPFDSEAEAERAADTIRGLRLDAVVIKP